MSFCFLFTMMRYIPYGQVSCLKFQFRTLTIFMLINVSICWVFLRSVQHDSIRLINCLVRSLRSTRDTRAYALAYSYTTRFYLLTHRNNLITLLVVPYLSQTFIRKDLWWMDRLSNYYYTFIHIIGPENVFAELFLWWSATPSVCHVVPTTVLTYSSGTDYQWHSLWTIVQYYWVVLYNSSAWLKRTSNSRSQKLSDI